MNTIWDWGIQLILFLQGLGAWLSGPMKAITFLGNEEFYLLLAPVIYWCIDTTVGLRIALYLMVSGGLNAAFKLLFADPRPYWYDFRAQAYSAESSFGLPSGHSQNSAVVFGGLGRWLGQRLNKSWPLWMAGGLVILVGVSRMYLGVHFPTDVFMGWALGLLLLWALAALEAPLLVWLKKLTAPQKYLAAFGGSLLVLAPVLIARAMLSGWAIPAAWLDTLAATFPGSEINPTSLESAFSSVGAFFGLAAGAIYLQRCGSFDTRGKPVQLLLRYLLGVAGVFLLWRGLGLLQPRTEDSIAYSVRYLRYALIGFWITGLAPLIFRKFKL